MFWMEENFVYCEFSVCTADDTDIYKDKIRKSCLRVIEKAEKLKQYLMGPDANAAVEK